MGNEKVWANSFPLSEQSQGSPSAHSRMSLEFPGGCGPLPPRACGAGGARAAGGAPRAAPPPPPPRRGVLGAPVVGLPLPSALLPEGGAGPAPLWRGGERRAGAEAGSWRQGARFWPRLHQAGPAAGMQRAPGAGGQRSSSGDMCAGPDSPRP